MLLDVKATSGNCPSENTSVEQEYDIFSLRMLSNFNLIPTHPF